MLKGAYRTYLWSKEREETGPERILVSARMRVSEDGVGPRPLWGDSRSDVRSSRTAFFLNRGQQEMLGPALQSQRAELGEVKRSDDLETF